MAVQEYGHPTVYEGNAAGRMFPAGAGIRRATTTAKPGPKRYLTSKFNSKAPARADLLKRYRNRIEISRAWRKDEGYDQLWKRLIDLYGGKHFKGLSTEDRIAVNIAFSTVNVIYPSISVNYPKISVWARKPEDDDRAVIVETVINYWWRRYKVKGEFRLAAKDFLIIGHGWVKCGYRYSEAEQPADAGEEFERSRSQYDSAAEADPFSAGDMPTDEELQASVPATKSVVLEDRPFAERVSPFDIFVDPEATSMSDVKWICQRIEKPIEDVKADKRYKSSARRTIQATNQINPKWTDDGNRKHGDDIKRVSIFEFYDLTKGWLCVFAESGDDFLVDPMPMPYESGHPFVMLRNYDVPDQFYPMGDLEALEPLQDELNKTRSMTMNHRKRYTPKWLYREDAFDATGRAALEDQTANRMVPVSDPNIPLTDAVAPMPVTSLPPEFYQHSEQIEADIEQVSGVGEYMRGALPEIRRTATEASIIQDAANARAADKLAIIEDTIGEVANHLVCLAQQFLTGDQVARIVGPNGNPVWVPYDATDFEGEYDFEVEAGSTQPRNEGYRRQQAMQMLNALAPYAMGTPEAPPIINTVELMKHVLRFGFDLRNPEKYLNMPEDPSLGAQPPQPEPPDMKLVETISYKDAPPDIQRQMEAQAGFQPSEVGGSSVVEQAETKREHELTRQAADHDQAAAAQVDKQQHDAEQAEAQAQLQRSLAQLRGQVGLDTQNL